MNWFRWKKKEDPVPGLQPSDVEIPLDLETIGLDRLTIMSSNVMWCRDTLNSMLDYVEEHRSDGHECPPFCVPVGISVFLNDMPKGHLIMLLIVLMKDLDVAYVPEEPTS